MCIREGLVALSGLLTDMFDCGRIFLCRLAYLALYLYGKTVVDYNIFAMLIVFRYNMANMSFGHIVYDNIHKSAVS